ARDDPIAGGYADIPGLIEPRAAAHDLELSLLRALWIFHRALPVIGGIVPILYPLPYIAVHIIQPPRIGLELHNGMRPAAGVFCIPGIFPQLTALIPKTIGRCCSRPSRILPLRFCRKPVRFPSFFLTEPPQKFLNVIP